MEKPPTPTGAIEMLITEGKARMKRKKGTASSTQLTWTIWYDLRGSYGGPILKPPNGEGNIGVPYGSEGFLNRPTV